MLLNHTLLHGDLQFGIRIPTHEGKQRRKAWSSQVAGRAKSRIF